MVTGTPDGSHNAHNRRVVDADNLADLMEAFGELTAIWRRLGPIPNPISISATKPCYQDN
jgi:hypothetical protein